jgi:MinD-like ATPase involved in chromosome partitioning or flagellar assembly
MESGQPGQLITIVSARSDGATSVALGLAAVLGARRRTVLVDLNRDNAEIATFLNGDESKTVYHLAYNAQLAEVTEIELRQHLQWHDGVAVLPGITAPRQAEQITAVFIGNLLQVLRKEFEVVLVDGGRLRQSLPSGFSTGSVLWVVAPRPLGLAGFERAYRAVEEVTHPTLNLQVVLNRASAQSLADAATFVHSEYGLPVLGEVPDCPNFWSRAELAHSVRGLSTPIVDRQRALRAYGDEAVPMRAALEGLVERITQPAAPAVTAS